MIERTGGSFDIKVIAYKEERFGFYPIMIVRYSHNGHAIMEKSGYYGHLHHLYLALDGGIKYASDSPYYFCRQINTDDELFTFLQALDDGKVDWDLIDDQRIYHQEELEEIINVRYGKSTTGNN